MQTCTGKRPTGHKNTYMYQYQCTSTWCVVLLGSSLHLVCFQIQLQRASKVATHQYNAARHTRCCARLANAQSTERAYTLRRPTRVKLHLLMLHHNRVHAACSTKENARHWCKAYVLVTAITYGTAVHIRCLPPLFPLTNIQQISTIPGIHHGRTATSGNERQSILACKATGSRGAQRCTTTVVHGVQGCSPVSLSFFLCSVISSFGCFPLLRSLSLKTPLLLVYLSLAPAPRSLRFCAVSLQFLAAN